MKIRDVLVIVFTAIVALFLLCRASRPDGSRPVHGVGGGGQENRGDAGEGGQEGARSTGKLRLSAR
jgi:hypothetical protein